MSTYKRAPVTAPRLRGLPLRLFIETVEGPLGRGVLRKLVTDSGIEQWRNTPADASPVAPPLPHPQPLPEADGDALSMAQRVVEGDSRANASSDARSPETVAHFARAYREGRTTPVEVAERAIAAIAANRDMNWFIASDPKDVRAQAAASAKRLAEGRPLSIFDGVPVAVKDEMDQTPYPTTVGTRFLGEKPAVHDATLVRKLREAGALLVGKANMHEIGINPIGLNTHYGAARNPWDKARITGGSSSGSAASVAAGIVPVAIGADGGGSIRIPAALCGVVGLKATWGRISEHGVFPLCWHVGHVGPIGQTVRDVAAAYALIAGKDPYDDVSQHQPPVELAALGRKDLKGVRLGIHRPWFEDADVDVVRRCQEAVAALVSAGAEVVEIGAPDLNTLLWTHATIILSEMASSMLPHLKEHGGSHGLDVRANLAIGRYFSSTDYVHALRHRNKMTRELLATMKTVDAIITPTTATTAPELPESALPEGESNLQMTDGLMRFIRAANVTGLPALAVPAGYDAKSLPVSLHLMGRPWEEALLLRMGLEVERAMPRRTPPGAVRLLGT